MTSVLFIVVVVIFIIIIASLYIGLFQLPTIVLEPIANTSKVILTFTYDSISLVKSDLGPNLISEAIGIATTVLIIDRIIKWREIRRWHPARVFLLDEISIANNNIIKAWKDWLIAVDKYGIRKEIDSTIENILYEKGYFIKSTGPYPRFIGRYGMAHRQALLEILLGKPIGIGLERFVKFCTAWQLRTLKKTLAVYLAENILPKENPAWLKLYQDLLHPMMELSQLVEKYQSLIDPNIVITVIKLPRDLEEIKNISSKEDLHYSKEMTVFLDITDLINHSVKFSCYLQRGKVPKSFITFDLFDHGREFFKTSPILHKMNFYDLLRESHKL